MTKNIDFVSVVCTTYNMEDYIESTINSVLGQTMLNFELIIVDDCSSDKSVDVIKKYLSIDKRINLITLEKNIGAAESRNVGIAKSRGRYICFLDGDDQWLNNKLEEQLSFMKSEGIRFSYTQYRMVNREGLMMGISPFVLTRNKFVSYKEMLLNNEIGCSTVMIDLEGIENLSFPPLRRRQDYALWLKLIRNGVRAYPLRKALTLYRVHSESISKNRWAALKDQFNVFYNYEDVSFVKSIYYSLYWMMNGLIKFYVKPFNKKGS